MCKLAPRSLRPGTSHALKRERRVLIVSHAAAGPADTAAVRENQAPNPQAPTSREIPNPKLQTDESVALEVTRFLGHNLLRTKRLVLRRGENRPLKTACARVISGGFEKWLCGRNQEANQCIAEYFDHLRDLDAVNRAGGRCSVLRVRDMRWFGLDGLDGLRTLLEKANFRGKMRNRSVWTVWLGFYWGGGNRTGVSACQGVGVSAKGAPATPSDSYLLVLGKICV